jgi:ABC-type polysaccharide/polyol phosphate transport system ATPase subunit
MPKITVGRDEEDKQKYELQGTGKIGKHLVGENEEAHAANPIYFDLARPHVMGIFGKRGTGKSYSMGTIAEEIQTSEVADNCSTIIIDSMGIYWSMKHPNDRAASLLDEWDEKPETYDPQIL